MIYILPCHKASVLYRCKFGQKCLFQVLFLNINSGYVAGNASIYSNISSFSCNSTMDVSSILTRFGDGGFCKRSSGGEGLSVIFGENTCFNCCTFQKYWDGKDQ